MKANNSTRLIQFKQRVTLIQESLEAKKPIAKLDRKWIDAQRFLYRKDSKKYSVQKVKLLDTLIPFLGYDWKKPQLGKSKLHINQKVIAIKNELQLGKQIAQSDMYWLNKIRRNYTKNKSYLTTAQKKKLDELNPLLEKPWNKTFLEIENDVKSFDDHIKKIKELNTSFENLPNKYKNWLKNQRKSYKENKSAITKENISKLDNLTSILKTEWSVDTRYDFKLLQKRCEAIKIKLRKGENLSKKEKSYLTKKRIQYKEGSFFSSKSIKELDSLNPLLGYDWKENKRSYEKTKTFEEHLLEITLNLKNQVSLTRKQKAYLRMQRIYYNENPKAYPKYKFDALEKLIPLLEHDWKYSLKKYPKKIDFEVRAALIKKHLTLSKDTLNLTFEEKDWLRKHRRLYRLDPEIFDKKRKLILDSMNELLGYDWKTYVIERLN